MGENYDKLVNKEDMKSLEETFQRTVDEELAKKMAEGRERLEKEREEEMKQKEIEEEKRKAEEEKEILEEGMKILEEREKVEALRKKSDKVEITYSSKFDAFLIRNVDLKKDYRVERKAMPPITPLELAEKMKEPEEKFKNIDKSTMMHLQLLCEYDRRYQTNKANQYLEEQQSERPKEERARYMRDIFSIGVHYDLTALYENGQLTEEEQEEILDIANTSQEKGVATVKKGMKVHIKEAVNKIKGLFSKIKTLKLPSSEEQEGQKEDRKNSQESVRTVEQNVKAINLIIEDRKSNKREVEGLEDLKQDKIRGLANAKQQKNRARNALQADRGELQRYILAGKADGKLEENAKKILDEKQQGAEESEQGVIEK